MDKARYQEYLSKEYGPRLDNISVHDFTDKSDRTLTYGYDFERNSWHVYLQDGEIRLYHYNYHGEELSTSWFINADLVPPKRAYPEYTDPEFADLMREKYGAPLCFTTFNDNHLDLSNEIYYGRIKY